jgi:hypothetical protein
MYILPKYLLFVKLGSNYPFPFTRFFVGLKQYSLDELQRFEDCLFILVPPMHRHQNQNVP